MTGRLVPDIRLRRQRSRLGSISGSAIDHPDEAIPSPGYGFNEAGTLSVVIQCRPKPFHGIVQALLEVHERVDRPKLLLQLISGDGLARTVQQNDQYAWSTSYSPSSSAAPPTLAAAVIFRVPFLVSRLQVLRAMARHARMMKTYLRPAKLSGVAFSCKFVETRLARPPNFDLAA